VGKNQTKIDRKDSETAQSVGEKGKPGVSGMVRLQGKAHQVAKRLHEVYGSPRHDNKDDPLDELIFIILSQMTTHKALVRVFDSIKERYKTWEPLADMSLKRLKALIFNAGLSQNKAPRIKNILRKIRQDFGAVSLERLREMPDAEAEQYLTSLPGVGTKTARCVMLFALGRKVLPVDTHVLRVSRRLELLGEGIPDQRVHCALEEVVRPEDRYSFHVNTVAHGRTICLAVRPRCEDCTLNTICPYPKKKLDVLSMNDEEKSHK
jgi:endonuclease III